MKVLVGHRTDETLTRYALVSDRGLANAGALIAAHWARLAAMQTPAEAPVIDQATRCGRHPGQGA